MISRKTARSVVLAPSGPIVAIVPRYVSPARDTRPNVAFRPNTPHREAGMRIDPPPSLPRATGHSPVATATPEPVEEPPATWPCRCGFRGIARCGLRPIGDMPYSVMTDEPRMTAPASRSFLTRVASSAAGSRCRNAVPARTGRPAIAVCSLITVGTPSSGPRGMPARHLAALSSAAASATSSS
jgi:hypothetical protein